MSTEISQKPEEVIIKNSEDQDNDSHSGNSLDIIIDSKDKKVKIGDTDNIKSTDNIESKIKFKKLENEINIFFLLVINKVINKG